MGYRVNVDPKAIPPTSASEQSPVQAVKPSPEANAIPSQKRRSHGHLWLLRIRALLLVTLCATFGVLLIILPWTPKWTDNALLLTWPSLRDWVASGFFRGICSGLGAVDLWLGFWEAIHYHETPVHNQ